MAEAKKAPTVKDVEAKLKALEMRVVALEEGGKPFVDGIEFDGFEEKLQKWLKENTLLKVAGIVVVAVILFTILF